MRKPGDIIGSLVLFFVSAWVIIGGMRLKLGHVSEPQPGFFPFWGGVILALLSGVLLIRALLGPDRAAKGPRGFGAIWRPMIMIIGLIAYVAILESLGYLIATFVLSVILLRVLGTTRSWVLALASLCLAFGSYVVFDRLLNVTLPGGILAGLL